MFLVCYVIFIGVHLWGVGEALRVMFVITAIAVVALIVFVVGMVGKFDGDKLFDIPVTDAAGASTFLPFGVAGVLAAFVYGIWFFLAVEGVPLAAEEASDPTQGPAARHHRRDGGAAGVRGADAAGRAGRGRAPTRSRARTTRCRRRSARRTAATTSWRSS